MHCNLYLVLLVSYLLVPRWSSANNCNGMDLATIRELRVEHLRNSIMAQLGLNEVPTPPVPYPVDDSELDPEVLNSYYQIVNATYAPEKCTTDDFYAKPIHSFVGQLSEGEPLCRQQNKNVDCKIAAS